MKHPSYTAFRCLDHHRAGVILCIARVHHDRLLSVMSKRELPGKGPALLEPRRIVVVVVEAAFANGNCSVVNQITKSIEVAKLIESDRIVRMHAGSMPDESCIRFRNEGRCASGAEDILGAAP